MCAVSMVLDDWGKRQGGQLTYQPYSFPLPAVSREEFERLRLEFESFKKLLVAAKVYDEETGQPDCELEEKVEMVRKFAKMIGVDVSDVFPERSDD